MRPFNAAATAALNSGTVGLLLLLTINTFPVIRLNSSRITLEYGGNAYLGAGNLGTIEALSEKTGGLDGLRFQLNALPADVLSLALSDDIRGVATTLQVAVRNTSTGAVLDAVQLFSGTMDQMPIAYQPPKPKEGTPAQAGISATAIHRGETFARPKPLRNTDVDQQKLYPGDTSRRFVVSQSQQQLVWPAASFFRQV